ncbi:MAG TPA: PIN domain-containing protein [Azoarcus sp.]|nr:PIN domain-containing protein [Azoarcus sp.]
MSPTHTPTILLDTNTVLALWWFEDPVLAPLACALDAKRFQLVTRDDALGELSCVLAYRQFGIPPERQSALLAQYRMRCTLAPAPQEDCAPLPICRDRDDQKFLEIARDAGADLLVSRDKALLRLNRHRLIRPLYRILSPEALSADAALLAV